MAHPTHTVNNNRQMIREIRALISHIEELQCVRGRAQKIVDAATTVQRFVHICMGNSMQNVDIRKMISVKMKYAQTTKNYTIFIGHSVPNNKKIRAELEHLHS